VWVKFPNGFLMQRGSLANTNPSSGIDITFPTPFINAPSISLNATASVSINTNFTGVSNIKISSVSTFNSSGVSQANGISWIAIGF
ncbi:gp53-like domain-containing protein, partial [Trabulsiella guamensis]|uniref:gp53-like domain-containing protein n=1 Tax=Trabulsiella guamensis TaxID=158852 RepID=UPI003CCBA5D2